MKEKYNNKILNVYKISFNVKCEMLFLVSNLKNNKSSIYQIPVNDYLVKEYNIFKYLINYKIKNKLIWLKYYIPIQKIVLEEKMVNHIQ